MKEEVRNADASATLNLQITGEFTAYLETFGETQVFTCSGVDSVLSQSRIQNSDHRLCAIWGGSPSPGCGRAPRSRLPGASGG